MQTENERQYKLINIFILLIDPDKFDISSKSTCNNSKGISFGDTI